jgi:diguanylate cyclase (GGDEF)-like protein
MPREGKLSEVLSEFASTMITDFPIQGILERLVERIVEILPITGAGVTLISPNSDPRYVAASDAAAMRFERLQTETAQGPCLAAYQTGESVSVADLRIDDRFDVFGPRAVEAGLIAVFTFPLHQGDKKLGALDLYRDTPGLLEDYDMAAAQTLADVTSAYLVNAQARSDLQDSSERAHESSVHDALTGLPNRVLLLERLDHALRRGRRSGKMVAILFLDLDRFKAVNDKHGHQAGDDLLIAVARRLVAMLRPADTLCRLAGDEFVILCEDIDSESHAEDIAGRVVEAVALPFEVADLTLKVSASVGIAFAGRGEELPERLIHDADIAMYQAKRRGGAHHKIIDLCEREAAENRASLEEDLRWAIERDELRVAYQPIVRTDDGEIVGVEALLRWDHPTRGPLPPTAVIPLAEQAGLITDIGGWVLERACVDRNRWAHTSRQFDLEVSVNVSAHQLMARDFVSTVKDVLSATHTRPDQLTLEITESVFVQDSERALVVLHDLKRLGVALALDDFGTGYSSLSYLQRFPIDVVKIDQAFTARLTHDEVSDAIVSAIIRLAHQIHMEVVTEGVETTEQLEKIVALGSEYSQGYYFSRPMSADSLDMLTKRNKTSRYLHLPIPSDGRTIKLNDGVVSAGHR